jgi:predicted nucleic-acid-binding protein
MPPLNKALLPNGANMIAIDTNILVRIVTNDSPEQVQQAAKILSQHRIFIPKTVILELEWVLRFSYKLNLSVISTTVQTILSTDNFIIEQHSAITQALQWYQQGMDFADALHLSASLHAEQFASFDKKLLKKAALFNTGVEMLDI